MRNLRLALLAILVSLATVAAVAAAQVPANWTTFTAPDKSFSVLFPGQPQYQDSKQAHVETRLWIVAFPHQAVFLAGTADYDSDIGIEADLRAERDNFLKGVGATLATSQRFDFVRGPQDKLPALEFTGGSQQVSYKGIVILDHRRSYMFVDGEVGNITANTEKFLNSVQLYAP